jgi:hypothetical protein
MVCGEFAHNVPMSPRTHGEVALYLCNNAEWCQARAAVNVIEALGLVAMREEEG